MIKKKQRQTEYFNPNDILACRALSTRISDFLADSGQPSDSTVVLCIGTDRATGDALGPLTGSFLTEHNCPFKVYGTLKAPVHALNLRDTIHHIYDHFVSPAIIAADASLGRPSDVGMITLSNAPLYPGIGVNKKLPAIGDISITGIVNLSGKPGMSLLQSTRLYTVSNMARFISDAILSSSTH